MASLTVAIEILGKDGLSGPAKSATASLAGLDQAAAKSDTSLTNMAASAGKLAAGVAVGGIAAIAGGLAVATKSAADFQSQISGIAAVGGSEAVARMSEISAKALQVGKDTSFSASEAASGMEELIKAGVSINDVLGGATDATVALAAATGVDLAGSAEIASNAMNQFNLQGEQLGSIADIVAGAANASAIDVNDFKFSLAAVGAVANTVGFSFKDTAVAIAAMGQAGIKGSDAGTSLKTMFMGLQPVSEKQVGLFRDLGLLTEESGNAFFDATGKVKPMREVFGILNGALANYTQEQKLAILETIFGSDAIRAGAVAAKLGAEGFDKMAESMDKVSAADVAKTRLDNLNGGIEAFKGSLETAGIVIGTAFLPYLKQLVDKATEVLNANMPMIEQFATELPGAVAGFAAAVGPAISLIVDNFGTIAPILAGVGAGFLFFTTVVGPILAVSSAIGGMAATFTAASAGLSGVSAVIAGVVAVLGGPITLAVVGIVAAVGLLTAAWVGNWGDIQGKTAAVWGAIEPILAAVGEGLSQIGAAFDAGGLSAALDTISSMLAEGLNALAAVAMQALAPVGEAIGGFFAGVGEGIGGFFSRLGTTVSSGLATIGTTVGAGFSALGTTAVGLVEQMHAGITSIWNMIPEDIRLDLELIASTLAARFAATLAAATAWGQSVLSAISTAWTSVTSAISTAWTQITSTIGTALAGIVSTIGTWVSDTVGRFTAWATDVGTQANTAATNLTTPITTAIGDILTKVGAWAADVLGQLSGLASTVGAEATRIGQAMVDGIGNALKNGMAWIGEQAANLAREAIKAAKEALGIQSPSTVFYEIGTQAMAGLANGIANGRGAVGGAVTDVMRTIIDTAIRHGIDPLIALALAKAESNFNPAAVGDAGASVGLFQLHERGQGAGMSFAQRADPGINAEKFLGAHGELFAQLKATGLAGEELARTFGRIAEGSDPQYAYRYAEAYRQVVAQFGNADLGAKQTATSVAMLGTVQQQSNVWAETMAAQQAKLAEVLRGQVNPASILTSQAMTNLGSVLGPIERQVAGGAISMDTLQFKLVDLARATGLATAPWRDLDAGLIDVNEAMARVVIQSADAGPQFEALRQQMGTTNTITDQAALNWLQLALNYQKATPALQANAAATTSATTATTSLNSATGEVNQTIDPALYAEAASKVNDLTEALGGASSAFGDMGSAASDAQGKVSDFLSAAESLSSFLDSHTFEFKVNVPDIPDWATPGSPMPLETALWGLHKALRATNQLSAPALGNLPIPAFAGAPASAGRASGGDTIHLTVQMPNYVGTLDQAVDAFESAMARKKTRNGRLAWER